MSKIQSKHYDKFYKNNTVYSLNTEPTTQDYYILTLLNDLSLKNKKVLEIGCGDGYLTKFLLKKVNQLLNAIDISKIAIENMRINFDKYIKMKRLNLIQDNLINYLKSTNNFYDVIIGSGILHHIEKKYWLSFFKSSHKKLNKNGMLVFAPEPNINGYLSIFWRFAGFIYNNIYRIPYDQEAEAGTFDMKTDVIVKSLLKAKFKEVKIIPYKYLPQFNFYPLYKLNIFLNKTMSYKYSMYITIIAVK